MYKQKTWLASLAILKNGHFLIIFKLHMKRIFLLLIFLFHWAKITSRFSKLLVACGILSVYNYVSFTDLWNYFVALLRARLDNASLIKNCRGKVQKLGSRIVVIIICREQTVSSKLTAKNRHTQFSYSHKNIFLVPIQMVIKTVWITVEQQSQNKKENVGKCLKNVSVVFWRENSNFYVIPCCNLIFCT